MPDPLSVLGATASIVQLVAFTSTLIERLVEFHSSVNDVPKVFRQFRIELPLLKLTVEDIQGALNTGQIDPRATTVIDPAVLQCQQLLQALSNKMDSMMPTKHDSILLKSRKAITSICRDSYIQDKMNQIRELLRTLKDVIVRLEPQNQADIRLQKLRTWAASFTITDSRTHYWSSLEERLEGTGAWFLRGGDYQMWFASQKSILWLYGTAGCGKSVLSASIIENLQERCREDVDANTVYFYFTFKDDTLSDAHTMVKSLIKQLAPFCIDIPHDFDHLYASNGRGTFEPSPAHAQQLLRLILQKLSNTYVVVDALDECREQRSLEKSIATIIGWNLPNVHLLLTSRRERNLVECLESFIHRTDMIELQNHIVDQDIRRFIQDKLAHSHWKTNQEVCTNVETELRSNSNGMFRWAALQLDVLCECNSQHDIRQNLSKLPLDLDETYERLLLSVSDTQRDNLLKILRWITFSHEPLRAVDIASFMAIDYHREPAYDPEASWHEPKAIFSLCRGLIMPLSSSSSRIAILSDTMHVSLSHFSVKEYLVSDRARQGPAQFFFLDARESHEELAGCCISYLLYLERANVLWTTQTASKPQKPQKSHGMASFSRYSHVQQLAPYCENHWLRHSRQAQPTDVNMHRLLAKFLQASNKTLQRNFSSKSWLESHSIVHTDIAKPRSKSSPEVLFYSSYLGLYSTLQFALRSEVPDKTRADVTEENALEHEPRGSTVAWTLLLLCQFSQAYSYLQLWLAVVFAAMGWTVLPNAGFRAAASLANAANENGENLIFYAIKSNCANTLDVLIEAGTDIEHTGDVPEHTPLVCAVRQGATDAMRRLLEAGACSRIGEALALALIQGSQDLIWILLGTEQGVQAVEKYDSRIWSSVLKVSNESDLPSVMHFIAARAFENGIKGGPENVVDILRFLAMHMACKDVDTRNDQGKTPLHLAVARPLAPSTTNTVLSIIAYLIKEGAELDARTNTGDTALHLTFSGVHYNKEAVVMSIMRELVRHGASINAQNDKGCTILHLVNSATVVDAILHYGPMVNLQDSRGNTPLHLAASPSHNNRKETISLLCQQSALVNSVNDDGLTPLDVVSGHVFLQYLYTEKWWKRCPPTTQAVFNKYHSLLLTCEREHNSELMHLLPEICTTEMPNLRRYANRRRSRYEILSRMGRLSGTHNETYTNTLLGADRHLADLMEAHKHLSDTDRTRLDWLLALCARFLERRILLRTHHGRTSAELKGDDLNQGKLG